MPYTTKVLVFFCTTLISSLSLAQDCNKSIKSTTPTPTPNLLMLDDNRFKLEGELTVSKGKIKVPNGTLLDTKTGWLWKKCSEGQSGTGCTGSSLQYTRQQALEKAKSVNNEGFAGYKDWRVPTVKELASIVERQCIRPAINLTLFPNTPSDIFWTSEPYSDRTRHAWYFNLSHGYHDWSFNKDSLYSVRLVRGRQW